MILATEASIAWRGDDPERASLATEAQHAFLAVGQRLVAAWAAALRFSADGRGEPDEIRATLLQCDLPEVQLDGLALLATRAPAPLPPGLAARLAEAMSIYDPDIPRATLSPRQALALIGWTE